MNQSIIDWNYCLKQSNNNPKIAKELLTLFGKELSEFKHNLTTVTENKHYLEIVHKLHGACCYVGVPKLHKWVEKTEAKLKSEPNADVSEEIQHILIEIDNVLDALPELVTSV